MTYIIIAVLSIIIGYLLFINQRQRKHIASLHKQQDADDNCYIGINVTDN